MDRIVYCDNCRKDTEYDIKNEIIDVKTGGMSFSYEAVIAFCKECGSEVSVGEINDLNIIRAYKAQKEKLEKHHK